MSIGGEKDVLGFEITVDDVVLVKIVDRQCYFGSVEFGDGVREALRFTQECEKLASRNVVHDHVKEGRVFERSPQVDQKWMSDNRQDGPFRVGVFDLLHLDHLLLSKNFDGVESMIVSGPNEVDTTKRSGAEGTLDSKVSKCVSTAEFTLLSSDGQWKRGRRVGTSRIG